MSIRKSYADYILKNFKEVSISDLAILYLVKDYWNAFNLEEEEIEILNALQDLMNLGLLTKLKDMYSITDSGKERLKQNEYLEKSTKYEI
jgi:DNA-binding PadR family transcriptional regulator